MLKVLYKPLSMLASVVGGLAATAAFRKVWKLLSGEDDAPDPGDRERNWREVVTAAAVQGAVFGGVQAAVDRTAAKGFEKATGRWPEK
jgi:hypothetical protein